MYETHEYGIGIGWSSAGNSTVQDSGSYATSNAGRAAAMIAEREAQAAIAAGRIGAALALDAARQEDREAQTALAQSRIQSALAAKARRMRALAAQLPPGRALVPAGKGIISVADNSRKEALLDYAASLEKQALFEACLGAGQNGHCRESYLIDSHSTDLMETAAEIPEDMARQYLPESVGKYAGAGLALLGVVVSKGKSLVNRRGRGLIEIDTDLVGRPQHWRIHTDNGAGQIIGTHSELSRAHKGGYGVSLLPDTGRSLDEELAYLNSDEILDNKKAFMIDLPDVAEAQMRQGTGLGARDGYDLNSNSCFTYVCDIARSGGASAPDLARIIATHYMPEKWGTDGKNPESAQAWALRLFNLVAPSYFPNTRVVTAP